MRAVRASRDWNVSGAGSDERARGNQAPMLAGRHPFPSSPGEARVHITALRSCFPSPYADAHFAQPAKQIVARTMEFIPPRFVAARINSYRRTRARKPKRNLETLLADPLRGRQLAGQFVKQPVRQRTPPTPTLVQPHSATRHRVLGPLEQIQLRRKMPRKPRFFRRQRQSRPRSRYLKTIRIRGYKSHRSRQCRARTQASRSPD